jgi:hypothetical protein
MKIVFIVIICIIIICLIVYTYFGGFKSLKIKIAEQGGETVVYDSIIGDYRQSGVVMDKIYYSLLNDYKIETYKGYGKYFDNPKKVEKSKLRSEAGCFIEVKDIENVTKITGGLKSKVLPTQKYIISEFPYKGKLSVFFSILKVYPALSKFAENNGFDSDGAVTEIYDIPNKTISYRKEILKK